MKIVYCLAGTYNSGGMERIVIRKANWLANNGYDITIITTEQRCRQSFFAIDKKIKCIDLAINYTDNDNASFWQRLISRTAKIKKHRLKLERVLSDIKPDITISTFGNEVGFLHNLKYGGKKILEIHFSHLFRIQANQKGLHSVANNWLTYRDRKIAAKYSAFVCLTNEDKKLWGNIDNIHVIPNFLSNVTYPQSSLDSKRVIAVGRLCYQKGYDRLIQAWFHISRKHPDWTLDIYGDGPLKLQLDTLIQSYGLCVNCKIKAPIPNIEEEMAKSSMLALSSHFEGLPMVFLEAMCCGLPIVSFDCKCGPKDIITDNGIIVADGDINGLSGAIIQLIENTEQRKAMGIASYKKSQHYSESVIMQKWETLFKTIAQ